MKEERSSIYDLIKDERKPFRGGRYAERIRQTLGDEALSSEGRREVSSNFLYGKMVNLAFVAAAVGIGVAVRYSGALDLVNRIINP